MRLGSYYRNHSWRQPQSAFFFRPYRAIILLSMVQTFACKLSIPDEFLDKVPAPEITSFSIQGVAGVIGDDTIIVDLRWQGDVKDRVATFITNARNIKIGDVTQVSGVTRNDFTSVKPYTVISTDNTLRKYNVQVLFGYSIADTGQTQCSSGPSANGVMAVCPQTVTGQDGDHANKPAARSFSGPTQHLTYLSDYTTKDNVTGLVWRSCSEGQSDSTCTGTALAYARENLGSDDASGVCTQLNTANGAAGYAGRTNWRLPTIEELSTLTNFANTPRVDIASFPATVSDFYWTSSSSINISTNGWVVNFGSGLIGTLSKNNPYRVRCVSGGAVAYFFRFKDNADGTIIDENTGLIWQRCSFGLADDTSCSGVTTLVTWTAALTYCSGLNLLGKTWRLPNANELKSIVDFSRQNPALDATFFPATSLSSYWSSSTVTGTVANAFTVTFASGNLNVSVLKSSSRDVRCVSGS
jgi:hypothetical protein